MAFLREVANLALEKDFFQDLILLISGEILESVDKHFRLFLKAHSF